MIRKKSGQTSVGYLLITSVVVFGVAGALYGPQIQQSISLLYTDAATRVIKSGPVGSQDIHQAQKQVWGSSSIPANSNSNTNTKPNSGSTPASSAKEKEKPEIKWEGAPHHTADQGSANATPSEGTAQDSAKTNTSTNPNAPSSSVPINQGGNLIPNTTGNGADAQTSSNISSIPTEGLESESCQAESSGGIS